MPDLEGILARLEPALGPPSGATVALDGGITNRNYRVRLGGQDYVVRLPGKDTSLLGISRRSERIAAETAARLGVGPEVVADDPESLVTRYVELPPLVPDALRRDPASTARALRAFHDSGVELPVRFWVPELLTTYAGVVLARGGALPDGYVFAQTLADRIAAVLPLADPVPCHDDLLAGNLMGTAETMMIVDWEYAGMGHRFFDLGNLAVNNDFDDAAEERLLTAYFDAPPTPARTAALKLMKIMSDAREAAWGVIQGAVSELEFDFNSYAGTHFDRLRSAAADPRFQEWLGAAAA
jgi:thiamine kinase-like enzyme